MTPVGFEDPVSIVQRQYDLMGRNASVEADNMVLNMRFLIKKASILKVINNTLVREVVNLQDERKALNIRSESMLTVLLNHIMKAYDHIESLNGNVDDIDDTLPGFFAESLAKLTAIRDTARENTVAGAVTPARSGPVVGGMDVDRRNAGTDGNGDN